MKVLFLDFDGVLNSKQHFMMTKHEGIQTAEDKDLADFLMMKHQTNVNNMWVLGYILTKLPDLKIVISSAWGKFYNLDQFKRLFKSYELDETRLIGITPRKFSSYRCNEINWWLKEQNEMEEHDCPLETSAGPCAIHDAFKARKPVEIQWLALDDHEIFQLNDPELVNQHLTDSWVGVTMNDAFKIIKHFDPKFRAPFFGI